MARVISALQRADRVAGDEVAVVCGEVELTYAQLAARCRRLGGALYGLGLERGDRVAVIAPNCHRYMELYFGVPGAGLLLVPLNARHAAAELRYALADAGARVLFTATDIPDLPDCVEHVFDLGADYDALLDGATQRAFDASVDEDELAGLFYTGGTTGASKGVMLSHRNIVANALHTSATWPFGADTVWLIAAPMFHAAGSVAIVSSVYATARQVILPSFDPAAALDLIAAHGVTGTLLVPTMLAALADEQLERPRAVDTLRGVIHGGSPAATETLRRAHRALPFTELMQIYGATELAPLATLRHHEERLLDDPRVGSCGPEMPGVEVRIGTPEGAAAGEVGEVLVRGANVMRGYWNKPEQTAEALADGWYHSGDLGYLDADGELFLVDRAKDMIVSGGENVYSSEVEDALYAHAAVLEAAVFAIPDPRWGEAVHAIVVPRAPGAVAAADLIAHCRTLIAGYKVPKRIELQDAPLPKSGAGKVLKRELRAPHWEGVARHVGGA